MNSPIATIVNLPAETAEEKRERYEQIVRNLSPESLSAIESAVILRASPPEGDIKIAMAVRLRLEIMRMEEEAELRLLELDSGPHSGN